jgi:hypothetical protein
LTVSEKRKFENFKVTPSMQSNERKGREIPLKVSILSEKTKLESVEKIYKKDFLN